MIQKDILFKVSFLGLFLYSQMGFAQSTLFDAQKVVPSNYATVTGTNQFQGPFANTQITYQLVIAASELAPLAGKNLVAISFRSPENAVAAWPSSDATFINYDMYLGNAVSPENSVPYFALNAIGLITQVRSGNLVVPSNAVTSGSNPNSFSFDINFLTPYYYAGGNLLVEIRHFGTLGTPRRVDAVNTQVTGYGTLFKAYWYPSNTTSINPAFEDSFSVVNFKATNVLDISDVKKGEFMIFPNPSNDQLQVKSNLVINRLQMLNMLGQQILMQEINQHSAVLDVSVFQPGTYFLLIENEIGISTHKVIKK